MLEEIYFIRDLKKYHITEFEGFQFEILYQKWCAIREGFCKFGHI